VNNSQDNTQYATVYAQGSVKITFNECCFIKNNMNKKGSLFSVESWCSMTIKSSYIQSNYNVLSYGEFSAENETFLRKECYLIEGYFNEVEALKNKTCNLLNPKVLAMLQNMFVVLTFV
jgi:hypothetical protein